jgi:hypothetical protein
MSPSKQGSILQRLADNAIQGIIIGVTLAFPIITLTTMNIIIGLFATLLLSGEATNTNFIVFGL